ncbi:hypothetical protein ACQ4LE_004306 [Meloidogyne hapla]|uniref:Uncharacterized protein n=1 Tax=Meloidogyne hapla TaxID=6305 RepID=A0A1I8AYS6_MELHA
MLEHQSNQSLDQLLTALHGVKLAIFDPLFCEQKIKSELPFLIARNAVVWSYKEQKQLIDEYFNKNDRISPIPERQPLDLQKEEKTSKERQKQLKENNKNQTEAKIQAMIEEFKKLDLCS